MRYIEWGMGREGVSWPKMNDKSKKAKRVNECQGFQNPFICKMVELPVLVFCPNTGLQVGVYGFGPGPNYVPNPK